jgi:hypothetical protein
MDVSLVQVFMTAFQWKEGNKKLQLKDRAGGSEWPIRWLTGMQALK